MYIYIYVCMYVYYIELPRIFLPILAISRIACLYIERLTKAVQAYQQCFGRIVLDYYWRRQRTFHERKFTISCSCSFKERCG